MCYRAPFHPPTAPFPGERRLVRAHSQSAFLISGYCRCLIFKCILRPNGNPYRERETKKRSQLGIVFHPRIQRQSTPPTSPPPPPRVSEEVVQGWEFPSLGWECGGGVFCSVSQPVKHFDIFFSLFCLPSILHDVSLLLLSGILFHSRQSGRLSHF